jgi:hypothetical protein
VDFESDKKFIAYKRKLHLVSAKIQKWHEDMISQKEVEFQNDSDFVNIVASPNDFSSDDSDREEPILDYEITSTLTSKSKR